MTENPNPQQQATPVKVAAPKFHKADTSIQAKVGKTTMSLNLLLDKTDDIMAKASREFEGRVVEKAQKVTAVALRLSQSPSMEIIGELKFLSHDLRGEAGSFGYELLGKICEKLNGFVSGLTEVNSIVTTIVDLHVKAIHKVASQKMSGQGGAEGEKIINTLANRKSVV